MDDPEICSCAALRQATRHLTRLYDAVLAPVDLSLNQYAILVRLERFGPLRGTDLAGRLVMDRSTLGHLLRPLEARGLVALGVDDRDKRRRPVTLTAAGRDLTGRARLLWMQAEERFTDAFGHQDARDLRSVLKRVEHIRFEETLA